MSDDLPNPALLPAGLRDLLPPEAETEAAAVEAVMDAFAAHGYQRVKDFLIVSIPQNSSGWTITSVDAHAAIERARAEQRAHIA